MSINLKDIPDAVKFYLDNKVKVWIADIKPSKGEQVNPPETFTFVVYVQNASAADGGIVLKNVKYRVGSLNSNVKIQVPASGSTTTGFGNPLAPGTWEDEFIYDPPTGANYDLVVGDIDSISFTGKAESEGTTQLYAAIRADVDLDQLFPKGEDSKHAVKTLDVID